MVTAVVLVLAAPAATQAAPNTWTVDPAVAPGCNGAHVCDTITHAAGAIAGGDTVLVDPGVYVESPTFTVPVTLAGQGAASVRIDGTLTLGSDSTVQRIEVLPTAANASALVIPAAGGARSYMIDSSILSGQGTGYGLSATASGPLSSVTITARHDTIADAASAPAVSVIDSGTPMSSSAVFHNSIVHGALAGPVDVSDNVNTATANATLFFRPAQENFHLLAGSPARGAGGGLGSGELAADVDGHPRPPATGNDLGADQYVNHQPDTVVATPSNPTPAVGEPITFDGSGSTDADPDDVDGGIAGYGWDFGDGTPAVAGSVVTHAFSTPGPHSATLYVVDGQGSFGPAVTVHVNVRAPAGSGGKGGDTSDHTAPALSITFPHRGQVIRRAKLGKRSLVLRGHDSDASGVQRIDVALIRRSGAACLFYDGHRAFKRRACTNPLYRRASVNDFAWSYTLPGRFKPPPGHYEVRVRGFDIAGNRTATASAAHRTLVTFRIAS